MPTVCRPLLLKGVSECWHGRRARSLPFHQDAQISRRENISRRRVEPGGFGGECTSGPHLKARPSRLLHNAVATDIATPVYRAKPGCCSHFDGQRGDRGFRDNMSTLPRGSRAVTIRSYGSFTGSASKPMLFTVPSVPSYGNDKHRHESLVLFTATRAIRRTLSGRTGRIAGPS